MNLNLNYIFSLNSKKNKNNKEETKKYFRFHSKKFRRIGSYYSH